MCHSNQAAEPGALTEVCWEQGGNKPGSHYVSVLRAGENGEPRLTIRSSDIYYEPYAVSVYRADPDALGQLQALAERHRMTAWADLPPDRENMMLDGLSTDLTLRYGKERFRIFFESRLPVGASDVLREFTDCLRQWAVEDRLTERSTEKR